MLATSRAPARPVRTRVSVLDAKLLTQTESPPATTTAADASFAGGATRIGGRAAVPERRSILVTVPRAGSATKRYRPALASHPGLPPTSNGPPDRSKRPRVEPTDLAAVTIGEPHVPARDGDSDREASDMDTADRLRRRVDPQHLPGIGLARPDVAAGGCESRRLSLRQPDRGRSRRERERIEAQERRRPDLQRPQIPPALRQRPDQPRELSARQEAARAPVQRDDQARPRAVAAVVLDGGEQPPVEVQRGTWRARRGRRAA